MCPRLSAPTGLSRTGSTLTTSVEPETARLPAQPPQAAGEMKAEDGGPGKKKKGQRAEKKKKSISTTNASQQKRGDEMAV